LVFVVSCRAWVEYGLPAGTALLMQRGQLTHYIVSRGGRRCVCQIFPVRHVRVRCNHGGALRRAVLVWTRSRSRWVQAEEQVSIAGADDFDDGKSGTGHDACRLFITRNLPSPVVSTKSLFCCVDVCLFQVFPPPRAQSPPMVCSGQELFFTISLKGDATSVLWLLWFDAPLGLCTAVWQSNMAWASAVAI